jgi:3-deoxy-D-manno-octulosonate 8-phosphate phosphatase (KDO 8-P phosphatase)
MNVIQESLQGRCERIELLVLDVDGVLTDGSIIYSDQGAELKRFYVRDGSAIKLWQQENKVTAFLTGRTSRAVELRAAELGVTQVVQGASMKLEGFRKILLGTGMKAQQACFIGDDLPDLPVLAKCGLAVAVADACPEVVARAHYVTRLRGGMGAVREAIELLLRSQNRWNSIMEQYRNTNVSGEW